MSSGRQALTIVGQVVGAAFGPIGAAIGGVIGGEIGGAIDGPPEGPRLDDTSAPALEFGAKVPRLYGTTWCTLSPRWWSGLRESSEVVGGKGGDSGVEQYSYHADLLGVLGEVDLTRWPNPTWTRVRVDGKVVASRLAASSTDTLAISAETEHWSDLELFTGATAQAPWSVMEAVEGATNAIAYRGVVSVGFTNFWMQNGRRPSLIEIEIAASATDAGPVETALWSVNVQASAPAYQETGDYTVPEFVAPFGTAVNVYTANGATKTLAGTYGVNAVIATSASTPYGVSDVSLLAFYHNPQPGWVRTYSGASGTEWIYDTGNTDLGAAPDLYAQRGGYFAVAVSVGTAAPVYVFAAGTTGLPIAATTASYLVQSFALTMTSCFVCASGTVYEFDLATMTLQDSYAEPTNQVGGVNKLVTTAAGALYCIKGTHLHLRSGGAWVQVSSAVPASIYDAAVVAHQGSSFFARRTTQAAQWAFPAAVTPGAVDLQDVLESEMLRCTPLTAAHIDMSAAAGKEVRGYKATGPAAAACAVLLDWYYLDLFCADKITVVERGGASEQTIPYGYSGSAIDGASDPFAGMVAGNDVELQRATAVQYINPLADGEVDTQMGARLGTGSEIKQINFPIYALPTEAKGRADTITHDTRIAAYRATVRLGALHAAKVQPASVLTLTDNKGNTYRVRVLRLVWNRGVYECEVSLDDPNILTDVGVTVEADTSVIEVTAPGVAEFLPLDLPKLQPADEDPGYLGVVKTNTSVAARWYDSADDVTYAARADYATDAVFGTVTAASGSFGQGVLFDEGSSLTVDVGDGTLSSATRAALLTDRARNAFAVGVNGRMAMGQFRSATIVSPGVYTLAGFVNMGAKGTEQYCASITAGDKFWLVGTSGAARIPRALAQLGVGMYAKAVAFGRNLSGVTGQAFTPQGVSLKPLSPVRLRITRDVATGDASITWARRTRDDTRFGGDLGDACPLGEAAEQYRVRLYTSSAYTTLLRDLGVVTTNAAPYTAAQLAADSKALTDPVYADIRMVSATAGEGYALQDTA